MMKDAGRKRSLRKRAYSALLFSIRLFAPPLSGFIISLIVVHLFSKELWGSVSNISLWVYLFTGIASWGSKDLLLRQFSRMPSEIKQEFTASVLTRAVLLPALAVILYITCGYDPGLWIICIVWLTARFLYNSYEPLTIFNGKFGQVAVIEIAGALLASVLLAFRNDQDMTGIIFILMLADLLRAMLIMMLFPRSFSFSAKPRFHHKYIVSALPFFIIGMAGLLQSRLEQLIVNTFLAATEKALCQIYMNLLLMALVLPSLLLTPITKILYRSGEAMMAGIRTWLLRFGMIAAPLSGGLVWIVVKYIYGFETGLSMLVAGILFCIPVYLYYPAMIRAYKYGRQTRITLFIMLCLAVGTVSGLIIIPMFGTTGAIYNAAITQGVMLLMLLTGNKLNKEPAGANETQIPITLPEQ